MDEFLLASAIILTGARFIDAGDKWSKLGDRMAIATVWLFRRIAALNKTDLFQGIDQSLVQKLLRIEGGSATPVKTIPGLWHPYWGTKGHPADRLAEAFAARVIDTNSILSSDKLHLDERSAMPVDLEGDVAVFGAPNSNELSAILLDYRGSDPFHLKLGEDSAFPQLRWGFLADASEVSARLSSFGNGQSYYDTPNWQVKDLSKGISMGARIDDGRAVDDYFLVTRLRNFLTRESFNSGRTIVIIGGAHGLGTVGFGLLVKQEEEFRKVLVEAGDGEFQALVKVSGPRTLKWPDLHPGTGDWLYDQFPSAIEVKGVVRLEIPDSVYMETARPRVISRLRESCRRYSGGTSGSPDPSPT